MTVTIEIPATLRRFTDDATTIAVDAASVDDALASFVERYPRVRTLLYAGDGRLRRYVNVFLNDRDVRHLDGAAIAAGDRILIVPAVAGG